MLVLAAEALMCDAPSVVRVDLTAEVAQALNHRLATNQR